MFVLVPCIEEVDQAMVRDAQTTQQKLPFPFPAIRTLLLFFSKAMEALIPSYRPPSPHLSSPQSKHSIPLRKPIFPIPLNRPKSLSCSLLPNSQYQSIPHALSASSSVSSELPPAPELEAEKPEEKFDWFSNWYPLAPVCDLDKRVPHAKRVMGLDVVVWWDRNEEKWQVFDDSCPHRLAPLSEGRIDQWGRLQCVYHGWCFDGTGDCKLIPQSPPDGPLVNTFKRACAAVYPSCEQNKIVWFWPSTDPAYKDIYSKKKPPYIEELDDPSYTSLFGIRDFPYGYEVLTENLMDPAHLPYAHYGILPMPKNMRTNIKRDREGGRPLDITIQTLDAAGFSAKQESGYSRFIAPCTFFMCPKWEQSANKSISLEHPAKISERTLLFLCIPVSPGNSRLIWAFPRNFSLWIDKIIPRWVFHVGINLVFDSDLCLLHLEERKLANIGPSKWQDACFVPTKSDALVVGFRRWLRKYGGNQVPNFGVGLPPTLPREQLMDRYWSHVVHCSSCHAAEKGLKVMEISMQLISIGLFGLVAAMKQNAMSSLARSMVVSMAVACFLFSKWLANFIYKNFHYHDYSHGLAHLNKPIFHISNS